MSGENRFLLVLEFFLTSSHQTRVGKVPQSAAAKEELEVATHRADLQFFWGLWSDLDI